MIFPFQVNVLYFCSMFLARTVLSWVNGRLQAQISDKGGSGCGGGDDVQGGGQFCIIGERQRKIYT